MKLAILTTQTTHHTYFVKQVTKFHNNIKVFIEEPGIFSKYNTYEAFDDLQVNYEKKKWFDNKDYLISEYADALTFNSINDLECINEIKSFSPNLAICYGTKKINEIAIKAFNCPIFNLHGGDPQKYRGLDTNLWAIWHRDFKSIGICMHVLNEKLDDGDIFQNHNVKIMKNMKLEELRSYITDYCVEMTKNLVTLNKNGNRIICNSQKQIGRYYSHMPSELKLVCTEIFKKYVSEF